MTGPAVQRLVTIVLFRPTWTGHVISPDCRLNSQQTLPESQTSILYSDLEYENYGNLKNYTNKKYCNCLAYLTVTQDYPLIVTKDSNVIQLISLIGAL